MTLKSFLPLALTVALAGCTVAAQVPSDRATLQATETGASQQASLPFKTVAVDPDGQGTFFKAGASETVVLRSKADLDAFIARHTTAVKPVYAASGPQASPTPPSGIPFGTPEPPFVPASLTETLKKLDFNQYVAIAFFDGNVKVASASRIVAVQDQGGSLVASTRRWDPPPNPAAIADQNGRLHVIALARTDKPVSFTPTDVVDGTSKSGGGYGVGGNPIMRPQWPAVPNPEITREMVESVARGWVQGSTITKFDLKLAPLSTADLAGGGNATPFTLDSLVWIAHVEGTLTNNGPSATMPGSIGGTPPASTQADIVISPEDGNLMMATSRGGIPPVPGFQFHLQPDGDSHLGDTLRFDVSGPVVEGALTMTLRSGSATPVVKTIPFKDLGTFTLTLDAAHVPLLTGAELQPLTIELKYGAGQDQTATEIHDVRVMRDPNAKTLPGTRIMGPGSLADYHPQTGESAADAYVRDMAATDWQGTGLTFKSHPSTVADVRPKGREAVDLAPTTPVRVYDVTGTFPTFLVPAVYQTGDADSVMKPTRLEVAVTETVPIRTVSVRAFAR